MTQLSNQLQENPLLAQMNDIKLPPEVAAWPPAPWVWGVLAAVLVLLTIGIAVLYRQRQSRQAFLLPRNEALRQLDALQPSAPEFALALSTLLKRAVLSYFPRAEVASLSGKHWQAFLEAPLRTETVDATTEDGFACLIDACYRSQPLSIQAAEAQIVLARRFLLRLPAYAKSVTGTNTRQERAAC